MSSHIIWNTQTVLETVDKLRQGADVDLGCFHDRNPELKAANILFQLTHEEEQEFIRCSSDIDYFVETYCRFLTDKGRTTVPLRPFQHDILSTLGDEEWLDSIEDVAPKVRNFILMASRQTGKCFLHTTKIYIKNTVTNKISTISLGEFFDLVSKHQQQTKPTLKKKLLHSIKVFLYKVYNILS